MNEKNEKVFCEECGHELEKVQEEIDSSYYECNNPDIWDWGNFHMT